MFGGIIRKQYENGYYFGINIYLNRITIRSILASPLRIVIYIMRAYIYWGYWGKWHHILRWCESYENTLARRPAAEAAAAAAIEHCSHQFGMRLSTWNEDLRASHLQMKWKFGIFAFYIYRDARRGHIFKLVLRAQHSFSNEEDLPCTLFRLGGHCWCRPFWLWSKWTKPFAPNWLAESLCGVRIRHRRATEINVIINFTRF